MLDSHPTKIKRTAHLSLIALAITLGACSATDATNSVSSFVSNVADTIKGGEGSEAPKWANEPLIAENECNNFTRQNVENFLLTYDGSQDLTLSGNADQAGVKAMGTYLLSAALINKAQRCMADALALKETLDLLEQEKQIILGGTSLSNSEIEKHREYSAQASQELSLIHI